MVASYVVAQSSAGAHVAAGTLVYASLMPPIETTTYGWGAGFLPCSIVEVPIKQPFTMLGHSCSTKHTHVEDHDREAPAAQQIEGSVPLRTVSLRSNLRQCDVPKAS